MNKLMKKIITKLGDSMSQLKRTIIELWFLSLFFLDESLVSGRNLEKFERTSKDTPWHTCSGHIWLNLNSQNPL